MLRPHDEVFDDLHPLGEGAHALLGERGLGHFVYTRRLAVLVDDVQLARLVEEFHVRLGQLHVRRVDRLPLLRRHLDDVPDDGVLRLDAPLLALGHDLEGLA